MDYLLSKIIKHYSDGDFLAVVKYNFRLWLFRHQKIQRHFRGVRYLFHAFRKIISNFSFSSFINSPTLKTNQYTFFDFKSDNDVADAVAILNKNAYVYGPVLNSDTLLILNKKYSPNLVCRYHNSHLHDSLLFNICHNELIISVVRAYLGFEPVLHSCSVIVDIPGEKITENGYQEGFHYDIAGVKSLNVFIYLTDVDCISMPHMVIRGSHIQKRLRDIYNGTLSGAEARALYGDAIVTLTGVAGTVIFENTEAFHRRGELNGRGRVFVNVLYTNGGKYLI